MGKNRPEVSGACDRRYDFENDFINHEFDKDVRVATATLSDPEVIQMVEDSLAREHARKIARYTSIFTVEIV